MSRTRIADLGEHLLSGRAWSGGAPIERVQVSSDGGAHWRGNRQGMSNTSVQRVESSSAEPRRISRGDQASPRAG